MTEIFLEKVRRAQSQLSPFVRLCRERETDGHINWTCTLYNLLKKRLRVSKMLSLKRPNYFFSCLIVSNFVSSPLCLFCISFPSCLRSFRCLVPLLSLTLSSFLIYHLLFTSFFPHPISSIFTSLSLSQLFSIFLLFFNTLPLS